MKKLFNFLLHSLLLDFVWILPLTWYSYYNRTFALFFIGMMITFVYRVWLRYNNPKPIVIQRTAKGIDKLYYISVIGFLCLTFWATLEGIINLFGMVSLLDYFFAVFFSLFIITTLFGITLMIKSRRSPGLLLALILAYLLFDSLTALPFNFLFFYEKIKKVELVNRDKELLPEIINTCDARVQSAYDSAQLVKNLLNEHTLIKAKEDSANVKNSLDIALKNLNIDAEYTRKNEPEKYDPKEIQKSRAKILKKYNYSVDTMSRDELEAYTRATTNAKKYEGQLTIIATCRTLSAKLERENNTNKGGVLCDSIKAFLYPMCAKSTDTTLQKMAGQIVTKEMPQLESIKELYRYIGRKLHIVDGNKGTDDPVENNMLITMSLSSSIVIDILPLLFSILYARFKRED